MVADVTVVGAGVIGLASAAELADRGLRVRLVGTAHRGESSQAAAGMLAPAVEPEIGAVHDFAIASRDRYPSYLTALQERTGIPVPLNRRGILEITLDADVDPAAATPGSTALDARAVAELEPALAHARGAMLHPNDGAVDTLLLLDALRMLVSRHPRVAIATENVCELVVTDDGCHVVTDRTNRYASQHVVLSAGAWSAELDGLPRALPIEPVRGQIVAFTATPLAHVVYGPGGYLVPKADGHTLAGSTMERVGFDSDTTEAGIATVRATARTLCPALAAAPVGATWAGLRPVTPDMLPLLGADPERPRLIYACGHSRNGVLLAPLTAEVVADLATGARLRYDLAPFRPDRF